MDGWISRTSARLAPLAREVFYVDLRSLATLRVGLGLVIIADLVTRARHLTAHYTDLGVAPRDVVLGDYGWGCYLSIHWWLSGSPAAVAGLFAVHGLIAGLLAAGLFTRVMTIACWYLVASLHTRLQLLHSAGDTTLQLLLFWSIFLPLGARWSLDARRRPAHPLPADRHTSVASFALLMQVASIYFFAAVLKVLTPVWRDGDAVQFALYIDSWPTAVGAWLRQFDGVLKTMTLMTLAWELIGSLLPFVPGLVPLGRIVAVLGFWLLHVGFGLSFNLGVFPFISSVAWLAFIPTEAWDRLAPRTTAPQGATALRAGLAGTVIAGCAAALVLAANVRSVTEKIRPLRSLVPSVITRASRALRLQQGWSMFTDFTYEGPYSGWYVVAATLADGREVDLLMDGAPLTWDPPQYATQRYGTARWTQFHYYVRDPTTSPYWAPYARYLCRTWADRLDIERITIWYLMRIREPLGGERIAKVSLHEHECSTP